MLDLTQNEARLFRLLVDFFGKDSVLHNMSVMAVCGGTVPAALFTNPTHTQIIGNKEFDIREWSRLNKCLFTIVDPADNPKLVVEFFSGFDTFISNAEVEHQRYLRPILQSAGIRYVTLSDLEFSEILDPSSSFDFRAFLEAKLQESIQEDNEESIEQSS